MKRTAATSNAMREIVADAWAESPARVVAAVALTPVVVIAIWLLTVFAIVAGSPMP